MTPAETVRWPLRKAVTLLESVHGRPKPFRPTDPFEMILWENCAYLVDDVRRRRVYDRLKQATGNLPGRIAGMNPGALAEVIAADGGMRPPMRAEKLKRAADLAIDIGLTQLRALCRTDPGAARRLLKKFPGIGDPGADKILMVSKSLRTLAPESNGLRVLTRLGFGKDLPEYAKSYRSCELDVAAELPRDPGWLIRAHQLLRQHGQTLCKTSAPRCGHCPLAARCPAAR
jgi:endonuclease-3